MAVPVTVIIPTYNWSAALRVSIASALAQTYRDFELLVIGDCCTDDSAEVVRSYGDPRVSWHNLPVRHKSQSGPNNYGIDVAKGTWIAYLGHDDVWHPDHLRSLLGKADESKADIVCGVCAMYGAPGSGIRFVSGIFVESGYRRQDFIPPSSLMHRQDLIPRIGPWGVPDELSIPVDCDLLRRAFEAGATIVSTERLTVFKFNSAWRRGSYVRRDASEQREMLARLQQAPELCVEQEWAALRRAKQEYRLFEPSMPEERDRPSGFYHHAMLRARGLESQSSSELLAKTRFMMDGQESVMDWHGLEHADEWGSFRWTGPSPTALLTLPVRLQSPVRFRLQLLNWLDVDIASEVKLLIGGKELAATRRAMQRPIVQLGGMIVAEESSTGPLSLQITVAKVRCPYFESQGRNTDTRWLGVCVNWIELEPITDSQVR